MHDSCKTVVSQCEVGHNDDLEKVKSGQKVDTVFMITFHVLSACIKEKDGVVDDEEPIEIYQAVNTPLLAIPLPYICLLSILQIRLLGNSCLVKQI